MERYQGGESSRPKSKSEGESVGSRDGRSWANVRPFVRKSSAALSPLEPLRAIVELKYFLGIDRSISTDFRFRDSPVKRFVVPEFSSQNVTRRN